MSQDQILFADDSQYINDITQKLARIRQTLGIDVYSSEGIYQTPQSDLEAKKEPNTFGKAPNIKLTEISQQEVNDIQFQTQSQQNFPSNRSPKQSVKDEQPSQLPQQISFLQGKLEELKQICNYSNKLDPCNGSEQVSFLERENVYLKIELELKTKQERFTRQQLMNLQEESNLRQQQLLQQYEDARIQHENFVQQTELAGDVKQYILSLESDLHLTQNELNLFTQRLSKEQAEKEDLQAQLQNIYVKARDEFQKLFDKSFKELQFMCQALSSELLTESIQKKSNRIQQQTNFSKLYQDLIDEKFILENKIDDLENKLESYEKKQTTSTYAPTIKVIYEKRLNIMKQGLLHWKTRTQQIEQIVLQWIQKLKEENAQLKQSLIKKQSKMFNVFENLLRDIHQNFTNEKEILVEHINQLQQNKLEDAHKIIRLRSSISQKKSSKK